MTELNIEVTDVTITHEVVETTVDNLQVSNGAPVTLTVSTTGTPGPAGAPGTPGVTNLTQVSFTHSNVTAESIASSGFNTVKFSGAPATNVGGGVWNDTTDTYQVPIAGRYLIIARVRISDSQPARSCGIGVHNDNSDGPHFVWRSVGGTGADSRDTMVYSRVDSFPADTLLRLYIYSDGQPFPVTAASLNVDRIGN